MFDTSVIVPGLICRAATEAAIDPERVKFLRTVRIIRRQVTDLAAFPLSSANAPSPHFWPDITDRNNLNPARRHRSYPRMVKRARHNSCRVKDQTGAACSLAWSAHGDTPVSAGFSRLSEDPVGHARAIFPACQWSAGSLAGSSVRRASH